MSSQRGNVRKGPPKHQNSFAFKHNPKSKKTALILALPNQGVCRRCHDQIAWRKKYRKYKPLTKAAVCNYCKQKTVTQAYHNACKPCAKEKDICAKCCKKNEIVESEQELEKKEEEAEKLMMLELEGLNERQRRTMLRKINAERNKDQEDVEDEKHDSMIDIDVDSA